jgi:DNA-binding MarR family transcriptional regulator
VADDDLVALAYRMVERLTEHYAARLNELGLSRGEAKALLALEPGVAVPVSTVAERIWADRSNTTNLVNRLVGRGLIERRSGPDAGVGDGRTRAIVLTGTGQDLRQRLMTRTAEDNPVFADLTATERRTLRELLARIDAHPGADVRPR